VERLAAQHVLKVPRDDDSIDTLLRQTSRVIQVQEVPHPAVQTVGQSIVGHPRFFVFDRSPGQLETWIEVEITAAKLLSNNRLVRDSPRTGGFPRYNCDHRERSYVISFWR
jgi:hypothetical protein